MLFNIIFLLPHPSMAMESHPTCNSCIRQASSQQPSSDDCGPSGTLACNDGQNFPTYTCSPPVMPPTSAKLTHNDFSKGGEGGAESECDNQFHKNTEKIVALSTGWFSGRCNMTIIITAVSNGMSVEAKVVDQCDSQNGCDDEHGFLPPCENNIVDGSSAVWEALSLDTEPGSAEVTWSTA
ncbi:unnamed protein product [Prunus armeniaca]|nr:unnamed protein product [Prunus armeniaca]